jgi:hypothetical protein
MPAIRNNFLYLLIGCLVCGFQSIANAQDPDAEAPSVLRQIVSVDSASGQTVAEYINSLKKSAKGLNIVVGKSVSTTQLPEIKLVEVPVEAAISCLEQLSEEKIIIEGDNFGGDIVYVKLNSRFGNNIIVNVMNIESLLSTKDEADILSAIEIGLEMLNGDESNVQLKLHKESKLLFAKGTSREIKLIDGIVSELNKSTLSSLGGGGFGSVPETRKKSTNR